MGTVEARRVSDKRHLWTRQIYVVRFDPDLEQDVQDVYIVKLEFGDEVLTVWTERDFKYELNLDTLVVTPEKGNLVIDRDTRSNG